MAMENYTDEEFKTYQKVKRCIAAEYVEGLMEYWGYSKEEIRRALGGRFLDRLCDDFFQLGEDSVSWCLTEFEKEIRED